MVDNIKICSLNCQGLGDLKKRRDVINYLRNLKYSIICLQDTHFTKGIENIVQNEWGYKAFFNSYNSRSRGVAILFNNNFEFKINKIFRDQTGNVLIVDIKLSNKSITLINIYGPNKDTPDFYSDLEKNIVEFANNDIIIVGDWNLLLNPEIDCINYKHLNNQNARLRVLRLMNDFSLYDVWREENVGIKMYTWKRKNQDGNIQMGRLDFFLVSQSLINFSCKENIRPGYRSDHSIIELTLTLSKDSAYKKNFWKFNNSLLYNTDFVKEAKESILKTKKEYALPVYSREYIESIENIFETSINPQIFLEMVLLNLRSLSICFSAALKKKEDTAVKKIELEINELETLNAAEHYDKICDLKADLQEIRGKKLKGSLIRSKARWIEQGEKPTKYFCNLENRNFVSKRMQSLIIENGEEITNQSDIKNEVKSFYCNLYKSRENIIQSVDLNNKLNPNTPKLQMQQALSIEGKITIEEASKTLKSMQNNKSPGSTGFTTEFFKFFWKDLGFFVVNSLNYGFDIGELSSTQKEGIITCIPKGDKCRKYIKNWRPISLLNITYKIGSGSIANRLKKILPSIIDLDQSGFMAGRFTGDNIRLIYDVLSFSNNQNKKGQMVLIDFEKAFDSVAWSFMEKCLSFYNFQKDIINWIKTFYRNIKSTVLVNNEPTEWFKIERGCRQGDPISPYIFLMCGEVLAHMIRQNKDIKGYCILDEEIKISQYADDTSLFLDGSRESFETCIHTVMEYAKYSGLAMNFDKTKVIWFGCNVTPTEIFLPELMFEWNPPKFTILGVEFTTSLEDISDRNIEKKLFDMQKEINVWMKRDLTPFGKITVIKTLVISKIVHIFLALPSPSEKIFVKIEKMLFEFLWDGKPDKIKRSFAKNNIEKGGLGMIDIRLFEKSLKLTWIRRYLNSDPKWKLIITTIYPKMNSIWRYGNNFSLILSQIITNKFWSNVLSYLSIYFSNIDVTCLEDLYETSFLYNEKVKIGKSVVKNGVLEQNNIFLIKHLMENYMFLNYDEFVRKYNINIDFLSYNIIIRAIKKSYAFDELEHDDKTVKYQPPLNIIMKSKKGACEIYKSFIFNSNECKGRDKWIKSLNITNEDWYNAFFKLKFTTKDTKLRWLQFRILHNILTTNRSVSKYKEEQTELCSFCQKDSETIQHLFYGCEIVRSFWDQLTSLLNRRCNHSKDFKVNEVFVLFGQSEFIYSDYVCDLIILLAKLFIYRCKVQNKSINIRAFLNDVYNRYCCEKMINKNSNDFINKWNPYLGIFKSLI